MKESIKKRINVSEIGWKELVFEIIRQAIVGGIAAIVSLAGVFGQMRPFGLAFVAAVPSEYLAMASFGSFIGYLFPLSTVSGLKYFAALFAIISIKALISAITKIGSKPIFSSAICSLVTLITGLVASKTSTEMALAVAECVISAGGAYFFKRFILPLAQFVSEYVGVSTLYIYALPEDKLMNHYKKLGFSRLPEEQEKFVQNHVKPKYDEGCIFMYQPL